MKAIGFFLAVFLSMLTVFLVATGEVGRWLSPSSDLEALIPKDRDEGTVENKLKFEFWDTKEGIRRFIIRAVLEQEAVQGTDPFSELKEISLTDGIIEFPLDKESVAPGRPASRLELQFETAVYKKSDGIAGKSPLSVQLHRGRGVASDGTEFLFEELLFTQNPEDKSRFEIHTDKPVRISRPPYLEVRSQAGLEGVFTDRAGFEYLVFSSPVSTFLHPNALDDARRPGAPEAAAAPSSTVVAAVCAGPLRLDFRQPPLEKRHERYRDPDSPHRMRIVYTGGVTLFQVERLPEGSETPAAPANRFVCDELTVEVDSSSGRPVPVYAVATQTGGRVHGYYRRQGKDWVLDGQRLEWFHLLADRAAEPSGETTPPSLTLESEALLGGRPTLVGDDVSLDAERAVVTPESDRIRLVEVSGQFRQRTEEGRATPENGTAEAGPRYELVDFRAPILDVFFASEKSAADSALSHFVARSDAPRGVTVLGRDVRARSPAPNFEAAGNLLSYDGSERSITLEGTAELPPRLTFGKSWIEAREIHLLLDEDRAWFEGHVRAHFDRESSIGIASGDVATDELPELLDIEAHRLDIRREGDKWKTAIANGNEARPVVVTATPSANERQIVFSAPEVRVDAAAKTVDLLGTAEGSSPAVITLEGGRIAARTVRYHQDTRVCELRGEVDVRLFARGTARDERLRISAGEADLTLADALRTSDDGDPLASLDRVQDLRAVGRDGAALSVEGEGFRLQGEEAKWDANSRELRFFGPGFQEISLEEDQFRGPVRAREIVYRAETRSVLLTGNVNGHLVQRANGPSGQTGMGWDFETSALEVRLLRTAPGSLELERVLAHQNVSLTNDKEGLKLLGEDLDYDHDRRVLRIFSPEERLQTLTRTRQPSDADEASRRAKPVVDRIRAQQIRVTVVTRAGLGRAEDVVVVEFEREVTANFHIVTAGSSRLRTAPDVWKIECETLRLEVDPDADPSAPQVLTRATAEGNVVASSDEFRAEGNEAVYVESTRSIQVTGSPATAKHSSIEKPISFPSITIRKEGTEVKIEPAPQVAGRR